MEKPIKHSNSSFLKFLSFQNTPFSPGRYHHKAHAYKGFSGPINFAVLPDEERWKLKNGGHDSHEPTSPKVSCMGQIKSKQKKMNKWSKTTKSTKDVKKTGSVLRNFFSMRPNNTKTSDVPQAKGHGKLRKGATLDNNISGKVKGMPSLRQMRKFESGRETLSNFDWTARIVQIDNDRDCYSDDERRRRRGNDDDDKDEDEDEDEEENEVILPFSAPMLLIGGRNGGQSMKLEPRKEVNLWKRRTIDPPPPLTLKSKFKV